MVTSPVRRQDIHRFTPRHLRKSSTHGTLTDLSPTLPKTPLFGTDGIRGRVGELLTAELARQIGFWAGQVLHSVASALGPVIVGQDSRNSSDILASALSQGLNLAGLEVWNIGLCPTPGVAYLTRFSEAMGGVMISASHNPPEDNGIKFFSAQGTKLPGELQQQIEAGIRGIVDNVVIAHTQGQHYHRPELVGRYLESLRRPLHSVTHLQGMKIVLDLAWGASVRLAEQVFSELGATVICLHNQPDGDRINVNCGSTHLACLQNAVREQSADMGFAFDGDADRVMAVDSQGRVIDGDYILYFWGQTLRQTDQLPDDLIVATVMANLGFERAWKASGGKLVRTAVGDQYVQAAMDRSGAMLGGEQSGHILCYHYGLTGDGMLTALHLASLVRQSGVSLKTLVDQSFQTYPQLLQNVRVENRDRRLHWQDCQPLMDAISQAQTVMADQGRVLVRASGTEPVIRVMVEAIEAQMVTHWTAKLVSVVEKHLT